MITNGTWLAAALLLAAIGGQAQVPPPLVRAQTMNGKKVNFPVIMQGGIATCVFGFGTNSADPVTVWLESLTADGVNAWSVVNLEKLPKGSATVLRMALKHGVPDPLRPRSLVISKYSTEWKQFLDVTRENLPVVVLFDPEGNVVWKKQGTFSASISDELKDQIAALKAKAK